MVHTFKCLDRYFALDSVSGSLFITDELTNKLIDSANSPNEFSEGEFSRYSQEEILGARKEIDALKAEGVLFSNAQADSMRPFDGIIKSMCFNISHRCNLRCGYCFAGGGSYNGAESDMSFDIAKAGVDFLIAKSGNRKVLEIDFFGGEPLLNFDVIKKTVAYARSLEKAAGKTFRFTVTTNALALSGEAADFLNSQMFNVVISIDGRKQVHNYVRKTPGGKDSFDPILKNALDFVQKRGDKLYYIRGTYTAQNPDFSRDAIALADAGFGSISLEPVVLDEKHPLAIKKDMLNVYEDEYERLAEEYLKRKSEGRGFDFFHFNVDLENGPCETKRLKSCGAGCEYAALTPDGNLYPCHQFAGTEEMKIGNVLSGEFNSSISKLFSENNVLSKPECKDCWAKYYCSGGCAANSYNFHKSLLKTDYVACKLMQKRLECALALYALQHFCQD